VITETKWEGGALPLILGITNNTFTTGRRVGDGAGTPLENLGCSVYSTYDTMYNE